MNFTETSISKIQPQEARYDIPDDKIKSLYLRVEPSGVKTWYVYYRHPVTRRRMRRKIAPLEQLTVAQAREYAKNYIAKVTLTGEDPIDAAKKQQNRAATLQELIDTHYAPWLRANRRGWKFTLECLGHFGECLTKTVDELTVLDIEKWQAERKTEGHKNATINRRMTALNAFLNWATKRDIIPQNPLWGRVERQRETDFARKIRYLSPDERTRLLAALKKRDAKERDYLRTAVLVSLNTGIRKGSLLKLEWDDINWNLKRLHLRAETMKAGYARTIPLNKVALKALTDWRKRTTESGVPISSYVFPGQSPAIPLKDTKKPWNNLLKRAGIKNFSWHCMRHDFASQLAMMGVDILTIKELLCHENIKMTLVYAHLSPLHTATATNRLAALYK